jgi:hypothetical protein
MKIFLKSCGFFLIWFGLLAGCKHEIPVQPIPENPTEPGNPVDPGKPCDPNTVYFQRDVLPILLSNCNFSGCHNASDRQKGVILDSYNNVMTSKADVRPGNAQGSDLYERITETDPKKRMPYQRPALSAAQIDIIKRWINQGAKNETCGTTCDSTNVTFSGTINPIIQSTCVGCHSGGSVAPRGLDYTTYAGVAAVAQSGQLVGAVSHKPGYQPMPQGGKLNDCQIALIKKWVRAGAQNN